MGEAFAKIPRIVKEVQNGHGTRFSTLTESCLLVCFERSLPLAQASYQGCL